MTNTNCETNANNDWLECVKWLVNLSILPYESKIGHKYLTKQLQLNEFASFLRDGELLCNLLNKILPGCIDSSLINRRAQMSQLLCLNNIRLFLTVCKSDKYFNMSDSDLFDEHMLYDLVDFACVIRTLSILSRHEITIKSTNTNGFNLSSEMSTSLSSTSIKSDASSRRLSSSSSFESPQATHTNDDIYYNIVPVEADQPESYYTDESFFGMSEQQEKTDNHVYQTIVSSPTNALIHHQPLKRDFVMREILNTEKNFLDGLTNLMNDFLKPLGTVLNEDDKSIIFMNWTGLIELHTSLFNDLSNACKGGVGRTVRICNVFESLKVRLMKEYAEYFSSIDRARARCDSLIQVSLNSIGDHSKQLYTNQFRIKLEECCKRSQFGKFKLTDLMSLPYQRVLKYHLLFTELQKQTDVDHSAKEIIKKTKESMSELGNYLNECQRDKENLSKIEQLLKYLVINNSHDNRSSECPTILNLLKDYGHYIKDDKFRIKSVDLGERSARTRTFFLFEKALIICKTKGNYYNYKETLLIDEYNTEDHYNTNSLTSQSSSNLPKISLFNTTNNNLSSNLSTSSLNLNSSSNSHSLYLSNHEHTKIYQLIFKNKEHKKEWKDSLLKAKQKMRPDGQRASKHYFELNDFGRDLQKCFVCEKYLLGLFYQGYKCLLCSCVAHKECLIKAPTCNSFNSLSVSAPVLPKPITKPGINRKPSNSSAKLNLIAQAIYKYDGRPAPPDFPALIFNQGDIIQVIDDDDDDWWKGFVLQRNKEGYFPRRHVKVMKNKLNPLEEYPWFSPVDRSLADAILSRIPNELTETLFMVRCRNEGGYAISIKHKGVVDHIKINICDIKNSPLSSPLIINDSTEEHDFTQVYSIDQQHNFNSIVSLIKYFSVNLLKDNFPQLDTTLGTPFKKALPPFIGTAVAIHDFFPDSSEKIELKCGRKYFVLSKEANGWWRVYNTDGLIGYVPGSYLNESKDLIES